MKIGSNYLLAGILIYAVIVTSCSTEDSQDAPIESSSVPALNEAQLRLAGVETGRLAKRLLSPVVACTGEIEVAPQGMASVTAPLGGYIASANLVPGRYVKKGQLLATLTNPEYIVLQQSFLETSGQLKFAEQDFERQTALDAQNATAGKKLQESESAFAVLKARLAGLKAQLELIGINIKALEQGDIQQVVNLRAPISGYVTAVNHHRGEYVEPRESVFELANMNDLHLHLNVFEQDVAKVRHGQKIRFRPTSVSGDDDGFSGTVSLVSPKRSEDGSAFDVHGHIEGGDHRLKPGMYVEAEILVAADSVSALPKTAVVYHENEAFVVVAENQSHQLRAVETGTTMDGWVEIRNADALEGKNIVIKGASRVAAALRRGAAR